MRLRGLWLAAVVTAVAAGCGGGSSDGNGTSTSSSWTAGTYQPASAFVAQCTTPRTGTDPTTGRAYPDRPGSAVTENNWLRSWSHDLYLWYRELPDQNPATYSTADYFNLLKTSATTPSGNSKDRFHFTYPTPQWVALSQSGVEAGYGAQWVVIASRPPRLVVVAYTEPNSPATAANLARGAQVLTVDGVDLVNAADSTSVNTLNEGLFPSAPGASHSFSVLDSGSSAARTVTMIAADVTSTPVQNVGTIATHSGRVGYMLFNDHIATAERLLIDAFGQLQGAGVSDLVLDIRYNGGGYLDIASEVAYMIAGPGPTSGQGFERTVFNDKYPTTDPVTGDRLTPVPFHNTAQGFSAPDGQPLPTLGLSRVFVLTSPNTCSASESDRQRAAGRGRPGDPGGDDHLREALRLLSPGQLRHDLFLDRVPGPERPGLRRLSGRLLASEHREQPRRPPFGLLSGRRLQPAARRSGGGPPGRRARLSREPELPGGGRELVQPGHGPGRVGDRRAHAQVPLAREQDLPALTTGARVLVVAGLWSWAAACATAPPAPDVPAVITSPTPEGRAELARVVSQALHGAPLTLADDALTRESTLIIERARARGPDGTPLLGRDTGRPERFRLVRDGSRCVLVHEGSGRRFVLRSATCAPK